MNEPQAFMVSPEKQIWHDFSSGKGGDIFYVCDDGGRNGFSSIAGAFGSEGGR